MKSYKWTPAFQGSILHFYFTLKMGAVGLYSSEILVPTHRTKWSHKPEEHNIDSCLFLLASFKLQVSGVHSVKHELYVDKGTIGQPSGGAEGYISSIIGDLVGNSKPHS
jgi:hypothetical protein